MTCVWMDCAKSENLLSSYDYITPLISSRVSNLIYSLSFVVVFMPYISLLFFAPSFFPTAWARVIKLVLRVIRIIWSWSWNTWSLGRRQSHTLLSGRPTWTAKRANQRHRPRREESQEDPSATPSQLLIHDGCLNYLLGCIFSTESTLGVSEYF